MNKFLGIDPGRDKTGLALVKDDGIVLKLLVAATEDLESALDGFVGAEQLSGAVIGDGTNSSTVASLVKKLFTGLPVYMVNEAHSTEEARQLYWEANPPRGLKRLLPRGLLVPDEPLDAYAAVVQVRRFLKEENKNSGGSHAIQ